MSETRKPLRAIGLLNLDAVAEEDRARDRAVIAEIARARGYELARVVEIDAETWMPITLIAHTAAQLDAVAVVAPSPNHFGTRTAALLHTVTLETLSGTAQRVPTWDATR